MLDLTLLLFDNHTEAIVFIVCFIIFILTLSVHAYFKTTDKEERKDITTFASVLGGMGVITLAITLYLALSFGKN